MSLSDIFIRSEQVSKRWGYTINLALQSFGTWLIYMMSAYYIVADVSCVPFSKDEIIYQLLLAHHLGHAASSIAKLNLKAHRDISEAKIHLRSFEISDTIYAYTTIAKHFQIIDHNLPGVIL